MAATGSRRSTTVHPGSVATLGELVGIAHAMEVEATHRYRWLAEEMRRRGETATAEAFTAMAEEEAGQIAAVAGWAKGLGEALPPAACPPWRLPREIAESWEAAAGSELLTPCRAYGIAADNEQRAFTFYTDLATISGSLQVAREAEHLAAEELRHAALLRVWRRAVRRRDNGGGAERSIALRELDGPEALARLLARREAEIASCHRLLALRLRALDDAESARLLEELAAEAAARATTGDVSPLCLAEFCGADHASGMLLTAQRPLERLCEELEELHLRTPGQSLQSMAETFLADAVARIARLGRRIEELEAG